MAWRVVLWVAIVLVAAVFLYAVRSILFPFVAGLIIATLLEPFIRRLRLKGFSRIGAVISVFASFFIVVGALLVVIAPRVGSQVDTIQSNVLRYVQEDLFPPTKVVLFVGNPTVQEEIVRAGYPPDSDLSPAAFRDWVGAAENTDEFYNQFFRILGSELTAVGLPTERNLLIDALDSPEEQGGLAAWMARNKETLEAWGAPTTRAELEEKLGTEEMVRSLVDTMIGGASAIVSYLLNSAFLIIFTPIITLLILLDYDNFRRRALRWVPPALRAGAAELMSDLSEVISGYVRGIVTSVLIYSTLNVILLGVLGVPYFLVLGTLIGIIYLIPYIGNIISMALIWIAIVSAGSTGMSFYDFGNATTYTLVVLGAFIVVGTLYDQLVHPRIVGRAVGLHPVVSFFVIFAGGALFGLAGMILAFPIAGAVKVVLDRLIRYTTSGQGDEIVLPRLPSRHQA